LNKQKWRSANRKDEVEGSYQQSAVNGGVWNRHRFRGLVRHDDIRQNHSKESTDSEGKKIILQGLIQKGAVYEKIWLDHKVTKTSSTPRTATIWERKSWSNAIFPNTAPNDAAKPAIIALGRLPKFIHNAFEKTKKRKRQTSTDIFFSFFLSCFVSWWRGVFVCWKSSRSTRLSIVQATA
jgi:hypothetical protein